MSYRNPFTGEPCWPPLVHSLPRHTDGMRLQVCAAADFKSYFFGKPQIASDWPIGTDGPLALLASIDFSSIPRHVDNMPTQGWLSVFCDLENPNDCCVRYSALGTQFIDSPVPAATRAAKPIAFYDNLFVKPNSKGALHSLGGTPHWLQYDEFSIAHFCSGQYLSDPASVAALEEAGLKPESVQDIDPRQLSQIVGALETAKISPARFRPGLAEWQLLLQIDSSDEQLELDWWDGGILYVLIPTASLKNHQFEHAWCATQSY